MARLVMTTVGSAGDLNPYIALASGLRQRGHEIVFAVEQSFARRLRAEGFAAQELRGDVRTLLGPYAHDMIDSSIGFRSLRTLSHHYLAPVLGENITLLRDICEGADALIGSAGQIAASAVADLTGIPWMSVALSPAIPTEFVSPITGAAQSGAINRVINRVAWTLGELALQRASDPPLNAVRAMYGLPPRKRLLADGNLSPTFTGVAVSPTFFARPADWPASAQVTGFLYWDTPSAWRAPPELEAFLSGGRPVIAVSTGSLGPDTSDLFSQFFAASVAAIHRVGARALVIGAGTAYSTAGPETLLIEYAPFSLVYPRCAAVIHHGGSGTLAQSLRAGVPTLVAPWGADQFFHAALLKRAGVSRTLARKSYTAERARAALTTLLHDTGIRRHAQELASAIAQEDGCGQLCDAIEARLLANAAR
jgi:UDP:flavonoid glycosyltransferase YjiC (YdhE family)